MKVRIVYDSVFGNTERIAQALGDALGAQAQVEIDRVGSVAPKPLTGVGLLLVGSPTRGFRPTEATLKFLQGIPADGLRGVKVAAFDTRVSTTDINNRFLNLMVRVFGYAAKPIADRLVKKGGILVRPPEGFIVKGTEGPLKEGELVRAADWARSIVKTF